MPLLLAALSVAVQDPPAGGADPNYSARSRLVLVPVTVRDAAGRPVDNLEAQNFTVLDNGKPQKVTVDSIATGVPPVALIIAVQAAGISTAVLEKVRKVGSMVEPLITGERGCAGIVSFSQRVVWLRECTQNVDEFTSALQAVHAGDYKQAHLVDAVGEAIAKLSARPGMRRVLLLISESRDRGSETALASVVSAAQAADVTIYAATYSAYKTPFTTKARGDVRATPATRLPDPTPNHTPNGAAPSEKNPRVTPVDDRMDILAGITELARMRTVETTKVLTEATGGTKFPFTRQRGLENALEKLGEELHTEYLLSFAPDGATPGYHQLEVRVTAPGESTVRARPGYWAK